MNKVEKIRVTKDFGWGHEIGKVYDVTKFDEELYWLKGEKYCIHESYCEPVNSEFENEDFIKNANAISNFEINDLKVGMAVKTEYVSGVVDSIMPQTGNVFIRTNNEKNGIISVWIAFEDIIKAYHYKLVWSNKKQDKAEVATTTLFATHQWQCKKCLEINIIRWEEGNVFCQSCKTEHKVVLHEKTEKQEESDMVQCFDCHKVIPRSEKVEKITYHCKNCGGVSIF